VEEYTTAWTGLCQLEARGDLGAHVALPGERGGGAPEAETASWASISPPRDGQQQGRVPHHGTPLVHPVPHHVPLQPAHRRVIPGAPEGTEHRRAVGSIFAREKDTMR